MAGKKQSTAKGSASKAKSGAKSSAAKNTRSSGSKSNTKSRASSAKGKSTSSKQSAPSVEQLRQRNQTEAILWFGAAILTACFVLIPGGSVWLMVHNVRAACSAAGYPACGADGVYRRQQNDGADHHAARRALGAHGHDCRAVLHGRGMCLAAFSRKKRVFLSWSASYICMA